MRSTVRVYLVFAVCAALIAGVAATTASASRSPESARAIADAGAEALLAEYDVSSVSLALVDGDDVAWSATYGAVDARGSAPTAQTLYGFGSVSKILTTVAVMQLVDAGEVDLDAAVVDYITDFRMADPGYTRITVRMLLNHSAGFPGSDYANAMTTSPFADYTPQVLANLAQSRLKSVPGSVSVYCNDCYTMAGLLVERVSGMPFTEYVRARVLEPLGMTHSMYATVELDAGDFAPVIVDGVAQPAEYLNLPASGGLLSTPEEMARLAAVLLGDGMWGETRVLSAAAVEEMGRDQISGTLEPVATTAFQYGLGWDTVTDPGLAVIGARGWTKGGDTVDYHATFMLAPDSDLAVIITAAGRQVGSGMLSTLGQSILRSAISDADGGVRPPVTLNATAPAESTPTSDQLAGIVGSYAGAFLVQISATPEDALAVDAYAGGEWLPTETYTLRSDGLFWRTTEPSRSLQTRSAWGRTYLVLQITEPGGMFLDTTILGEKLVANGPLAPSWSQRLGQTWVIVDERPDSLLWNGNPALTLADPDDSGYLWVTHAQGSTPVDPRGSDDFGSMFIQIPAVNGRDMNDLRVFSRDGEEWVGFGSSTYRPADTLPPLEEGETQIRIGEDAAAQWRSVPADMRLETAGNDAWRAYTPDGHPIDAAEVSGVLPVGSLVVVFGEAGETITLRAERP